MRQLQLGKFLRALLLVVTLTSPVSVHAVGGATRSSDPLADQLSRVREQMLTAGRPRSRALLRKMIDSKAGLTSQQRKQLLAEYEALHRVFLTDAAQTLHLKAAAFAKQGQCSKSIDLWNQARSLEADNFEVLEGLRVCQKYLFDTEGSHLTLLALNDVDPYDEVVLHELAVSHLFRKEFKELETLLAKAELKDPELKSFYLVALIELGRGSEAIFALRELVRRGSLTRHDELGYYLATALVEDQALNSESRTEARLYLKRFLQTFEMPGPFPSNPFHPLDKIADARKKLASLK